MFQYNGFPRMIRSSDKITSNKKKPQGIFMRELNTYQLSSSATIFSSYIFVVLLIKIDKFQFCLILRVFVEWYPYPVFVCRIHRIKRENEINAPDFHHPILLRAQEHSDQIKWNEEVWSVKFVKHVPHQQCWRTKRKLYQNRDRNGK